MATTSIKQILNRNVENIGGYSVKLPVHDLTIKYFVSRLVIWL